MEELEQLIALLRPDSLYFLKKDSTIQILVKDIVSHEMHINKISIFEYKNKIQNETTKFISNFTKKVLNSSNAKINYNYVKSYILKFGNEFRQFKDGLIEDKSFTTYYCENVEQFMDESNEPLKNYKKLYSELDKEFQVLYQEYFDTVKTAINKITSTINNIDINDLESNTPASSNTNSTTPEKIKLNLSVGEIALLFRLLKENNTIVDSKSNADLYRSISTIFASKKTEHISTNSLNKKFHEPDQYSLSEIETLLTNLKLVLKKIK